MTEERALELAHEHFDDARYPYEDIADCILENYLSSKESSQDWSDQERKILGETEEDFEKLAIDGANEDLGEAWDNRE